jgi:peptidoglycan/xylan/chitin deacetylase (PgdA/CDA1 family)
MVIQVDRLRLSFRHDPPPRHQLLVGDDVTGRLTYVREHSILRGGLLAAQSLLGRSHLANLYARRRGLTGAVVLCYHSIASQPDSRWIDPGKRVPVPVFRNQMRFLAKHRHVVSLDRIVAAIASGERLPAGTVAITFDDGYRDNMTEAFPILHSLGLPATVFLPTRYIDDAEPAWINRLYAAVMYRTTDELDIDVPFRFRASFASASKRLEAYRALSDLVFELDYDTRVQGLRSIAERLGSPLPSHRIGMNWADVRESRVRFPKIQFGSHTVTHLDMNAACTATLQQELTQSKLEIEGHLQEAVEHFAYPYSRVGPDNESLVAAAGYRAAFAGAEGVRVGPEAPLYRVPRIDAPASLGRLALITSGAFPELSMQLFNHV